MKRIKLYEVFFYGQDGKTGSMDSSVPNRGKSGIVYLDMLPKGLKNELTRTVKDMLMNSNASDWDALDYIMPKIEKLMAKSGLQWNRFPGVMGVSGIKTMDQFINWLEKGYCQALEDAYFA